ncbi:hypothetical protein DFH06DRAFT_1136635 [Mycena polygramma]|nr:hypothetical protein DFH06DRAFT_1136635 [Mycena polygramma]
MVGNLGNDSGEGYPRDGEVLSILRNSGWEKETEGVLVEMRTIRVRVWYGCGSIKWRAPGDVQWLCSSSAGPERRVNFDSQCWDGTSLGVIEIGTLRLRVVENSSTAGYDIGAQRSNGLQLNATLREKSGATSASVRGDKLEERGPRFPRETKAPWALRAGHGLEEIKSEGLRKAE